MPTEKLPISEGQNKNANDAAISTGNIELIDGYLDDQGYANIRPGLETKASLHATPTPSSSWDGIYWWDALGQLIGVWNGNIYKITYPGFAFTQLTGVSLPAGRPVTFAEDVDGYLFLAAGNKVVYTNGTTIGYHPSANISQNVTHVVFMDQRLINNQPNTAFQYSAIGDSLTYAALNTFSAESAYDPISAIYKFNQEIYLFGRKSVEIWESGTSTDFQRVPGGVLNVGCLAPYSVISADNAVMWLSDNKRFVVYDGKQVESFSTNFDRELDTISDPTDCTAHRVEIGGQAFLMFRFVAGNRTLVFNAKTKTWSEWGCWNPTLGRYDNFIGRSYTFIPTYGAHIWGQADGSSLFQMTDEIATDGSSPIRFKLKTAHIDFGSTMRKRTEEIRMRLRRGEVSASEATMQYRYQTDRARWSNERPISLGLTGDTQLIGRIRRTGIYRARQHEFVAVGVKKFCIGGVEEDFTWLK